MVDKLRLARLVKVYEAMWRALSGLEWRKPGAGSVVRTLEDEAAINGTSIEQHNRIINLSDHFPTIEIKIISGLVNEKNQLDPERLQQDLYWAFVLLSLVDKSYDALPLAILGMPSLAGSKPDEKAINRFLELAYANDSEGKKIAAALFEQLKERTAGLSEGERNNRNQVMRIVYERFGLWLVYKSHQQYQGYDEEIVEHLLQPKTLVQLAQDLINAGWSNEQALGFFPNEMHLALLEALIKVRVGEQPAAEQQLIKPTGMSEAKQQEFGDIFNPVPLDQAYDPQRLNLQARQQLIDAVRSGNPDEFRKVLSESNCSINSKTNRINFLPQSNNVVREGNYRAVIADVGIKIEAIAGRLALEKFNHNMQEGGFFKRLWRRSIYYRWTRPALLKRYAGEFEQALYDLVNNGIAIDNNKLPELGNEFARKGIPFNSAESFLANLDNIVERIEEQQKLGAVVTDAFDARETPMNRAFPSATVQKAIDDINKLIINYIQSNMTDEDFNKALRPILNSIRNELGAKVLGSNLLSKAKELRNAGNINLDNFKLDIAFTNAKEADVRVRNTGGRINQAVTKVINKTQSIPVARWFTSPMALGLAAFLGVNGGMMLSAGALSGLIVPALAVAIPIGILAGMRQNAEVNQNYQQVDLRQSLGLTTAKATKLEQKLQKAVVDKLDVQKAIKDLSVANADKDKVVILIGEILSRITQGRESGIELFKYAPNIDEEKQKVDLLRSVNSLIVGLKLSPDELKKSQQDETAKLQQKINISNKNFRKVKSREDIKAVVISAGTAIAFSYLIGWLFRGWMGMGSQPVSNTAGAAAPSSKQVTAYTLQEFLAKNSGKLNSSELQSALKEAGISNPKKIISELFPSGKVSIGKLIEHLTSGSASGEKLAAVLEKYVERACGGIDIQFANSSNFLRVLWQAPGLKEQLQKKGIKDFSKFAAAFEKEMSSITKGSWSLSGTLKGILSNNHLAKDAETIILQGINKSPSLKANLEEVLRQNDFLGSQGSIQRFFENFTDGGRVIGSTMARYKQFMVNPAKFQKFVNKALGIYKTAGTNSNWAQAGQQLRSLLWKEGVLHPADRVNIAFDWVHRFSGWNVKAVEGTATNDFLRIFFDITRIAQPIKLTEAAGAVEQTVAETAKALGYFLGPMLSGAPYKGLGELLVEGQETMDDGRGTKDEGETKDEGREKKDEIKLSVPEDLKQGQGQDGQQINEGRGTREEGQTKDDGRGTKDDVQNLAAAQGTLTTLEFDLKQAEDKSAELEKQSALPVSTTPLQPAQPQPPVSELSQPSQQPQTDNNAPERAGNAMGIDAEMQKEIIELWQKKGGGNFDSFKTEFKVKFPGLTIEVVKKIREDWIIAVIHKGEENKGIFLPRKKAAVSDVYAYLGFDGSTIDTRYRILEGLQAPLPDCKKGDDGVWMIDGSSRVKIQVEWQSGVREDNSKREWLGPPKLESIKQNLSFFKTDLENLKKSLAEVNESLVEPEKKVETHSDSLAIAQAELTAAMQAGDSDAQKEKFQTVEYIKKQLKGKQLFIQIQKEKIGKNLKEQEEIEVKIAKMEREIQVMQDENFEKPSITPTTLTLLPAPQADVDGKESQTVSSSLVDNKGGIDLTHMPAAIMRQPALINPAAGLTPALSREIFSINLNQECGQIEKMMAADIAVSDERLRVLMIVCCRSASSSVSLDKMRDYIAFKIRIDEKFCRPTNTALLKMLELLELNQPPEVMINTLASLSIAPKR